MDTVAIPGLERWRVWGQGQEYGNDEQRLRDLETVLRARGWSVEHERELLRRVRTLDPYFGVDQLLQKAVRAASFDDWKRDAEQLLERDRS